MAIFIGTLKIYWAWKGIPATVPRAYFEPYDFHALLLF